MLFFRKDLLTLIFIFLFFCTSCISLKKSGYSYTLNTCRIDTLTGKQVIFFSNQLTYGSYLFEFQNKVNIQKEIHGTHTSKSVTYDTSGVYLLDGVKRQYFEFDSFILSRPIVSKGDFNNKPWGRKFLPVNKTKNSSSYFGPMKDTMINGIPCFYSDVFTVNKNEKDSTAVKVILIKGKQFNSLYKINGLEFTNKNYCILGFNIYSNLRPESIVTEINNLRPLSNNEKLICKRLIKASGL